MGVTDAVAPGTEAMLVALVLHPWEHDVTVATTVSVSVEAMTGVGKTVATSVVRTVTVPETTSNVQSVHEEHSQSCFQKTHCEQEAGLPGRGDGQLHEPVSQFINNEACGDDETTYGHEETDVHAFPQRHLHLIRNECEYLKRATRRDKTRSGDEHLLLQTPVTARTQTKIISRVRQGAMAMIERLNEWRIDEMKKSERLRRRTKVGSGGVDGEEKKRKRKMRNK